MLKNVKTLDLDTITAWNLASMHRHLASMQQISIEDGANLGLQSAQRGTIFIWSGSESRMRKSHPLYRNFVLDMAAETATQLKRLVVLLWLTLGACTAGLR